MDITRKLASIRQVHELVAIEGADLICVAKIDGWQCVVKVGEFVPGDLCVYFEVDSFLPVRPEFEFLRKSSFKRMGDSEGFRLKTIRLRGQLSQGLALPLSALPETLALGYDGGRVGVDVTELLEVVKYEAPVPVQLAGIAKGNFPGFIQKTDQERIQNIPDDFIANLSNEFQVTQKLDGSSCTMYVNDGVFGVCSRNIDLKETEGNVFWQMARKYDVEAKLRAFSSGNIAIQGEVCGPSIQNNHERLPEVMFFVFDVFDIDRQEYFNPTKALFMASALNIPHVPVISERIVLNEVGSTVADILTYADGRGSGGNVREGVVFKRLGGNRFSFKAISNAYLLTHE